MMHWGVIIAILGGLVGVLVFLLALILWLGVTHDDRRGGP